ncbi:MAG: DUF5050 domain-containing protein [Eubacterium sp.]|nr:DUF5050 domain-containing protein [Eubacterium sp.]
MDIKKLTRTSVTLVLAAVIAFGCTAFSFADAGAGKTTIYSAVYKASKNTYCTDGYSIFRVNNSTGKVKKLTPSLMDGCWGFTMHKGYIYYIQGTNGTVSYLCRVKTNGKSRKQLTGAIEEMEDFAISGSRIYYSFTTYKYNPKTEDDETVTVTKSMKLNGTDKKKDTFVFNTKHKKSNVKGYKIIEKKSKDFAPWDGKGTTTTYLKKPNGKKIKLYKHNGKNMFY